MPAFAQRMRLMQRSRLHEMHRLLSGRPDLISLANGAPAADLYPVERIAVAWDSALTDKDPTVLNYSLTEGFEPLREWIAQKAKDSGISCTASDILITNGIQQALGLAGRIALDPQDQVVVDSPTYPGLLDALSIYEPAFRPITLLHDHKTTNVEHIRAAIAQDRERRPFRIKMLYVIPNFHNPAGTIMNVPDRRALAALAEEYDVLVIEDDAYGDLRYDGERLPSIKSFDQSGNVIYLGSFSKILAPGIRLGWMIAARQVLERLVMAKQAEDLHTSGLSQVVAYQVTRDGFVDAHIQRLVSAYRQRRDALVDAMETALPDEIHFVRPTGGFFVWVDFPTCVDADALFDLAIQHGVVCLPGTWFHLDNSGGHSVRLSYSAAPPAVLAEGVRRLAVAVDAVSGRK